MSTPTSRRPEPSNTALARRLDAVEARLADLEGPVLDGTYRIRREVVGLRITLGRLAEQAGVPVATDDEIDAALDEAS